MKKNDTEKFLLNNLKISDGLEVKENEIEEFIDSSDTVFEQCNHLFTTGIEFLKAGPNSGMPAPIPAWQNSRVSQKEINNGINVIEKMMLEATPLLNDVTDLSDQYNEYCKDITSYMDNMSRLMTEFNEHKENAASVQKSIFKLMEQLPPLDLRLNKLLAKSRKYNVRLQALRQQLNLIKEVN